MPRQHGRARARHENHPQGRAAEKGPGLWARGRAAAPVARGFKAGTAAPAVTIARRTGSRGTMARIAGVAQNFSAYRRSSTAPLTGDDFRRLPSGRRDGGTARIAQPSTGPYLAAMDPGFRKHRTNIGSTREPIR